MKKYKLRPSSMGTINLCPAAALIPAIVVDHTSPAAESGVELHAVSTRSQITGAPLPEWLTDEQRALLLLHADCNGKWPEISLQTDCLYDHLTPDERALFDVQPCRSDLIYFRDDKLVIRDLKTGTQYVEVKDNLQLLDYAICAAEYFDCNDLSVDLEICQMVDGEPTITVASYTVDELEVQRLKIKLIIDKLANTDNPEHCPGDHCAWCWRLHECVCHADDNVTVPAEIDCTERFLIDNRHRITNIDLQIKALEKLKDAVKSELRKHHNILAGFRLIGYDRKNTEYKSIDKMLETLTALGYSRSKLAELRPIAFGKLCNLLKPEHLAMIKDHIIMRTSRVEKIVTDDNNGPSAEDFEEVPQ